MGWRKQAFWRQHWGLIETIIKTLVDNEDNHQCQSNLCGDCLCPGTVPLVTMVSQCVRLSGRPEEPDVSLLSSDGWCLTAVWIALHVCSGVSLLHSSVTSPARFSVFHDTLSALCIPRVGDMTSNLILWCELGAADSGSSSAHVPVLKCRDSLRGWDRRKTSSQTEITMSFWHLQQQSYRITDHTHDCSDNQLFSLSAPLPSKAGAPRLSLASLLSAQRPLYSWKWSIYERLQEQMENQDI